jgi:hypothetical protein
MRSRAPLTALRIALGGALLFSTPTLEAQDDYTSLDDLDADLAELGGGGSADSSGFGVSEFGGFVAEEFRAFPVDRGQGKNDEQLISEVQLDLDLRIAGGLHAVVTPWFYLDAFDTEILRYEPLEGYLSYTGESWDILGGQFIESWGIADTFNPLDVLNRRDFATDLLDPTVRGELGARVRWTLPESDTIGEPTWGVYALPVFRETDFPPEDQRFGFSSPDATFDEESIQGPAGVNRVMAAIRFDHTLNTSFLSADLQYLAVRGPSRSPVVVPIVNPDFTVSLTPEYFGEWVFGGGLRAVPEAAGLSKFTLKGEFAYKRPYAFSNYSGPDLALPREIPEDYFQFAAGIDRSFPHVFSSKDEFTLTLEYAGEVGADDQAAVFRPFDSDIAGRLAWSAGDFARTSIEARGVVDVTNGEIIAEGLASRQLRFIHDDLKLEVGGRYLRAAPSEATLLNAFPTNNSSLRARLQFDF